jgi:hypothetical protein
LPPVLSVVVVLDDEDVVGSVSTGAPSRHATPEKTANKAIGRERPAGRDALRSQVMAPIVRQSTTRRLGPSAIKSRLQNRLT